MREIELFHEIVQSAVRIHHAEYLKEQKRVPLPLDLPTVEDLPAAAELKAMKLSARIALRYRHKKQIKARKKAERKRPLTVEDKLLKGYNAGIEKALSIFESEFRKFEKRLVVKEREEEKLRP